MSDAPPPTAQGNAGRKPLLALAAVMIAHAALVLYHAPPRVMFGGHAVVTWDYAMHGYQASRALEAFRGWGKLWSYDPFMLAGQPAGAVEDLTSKSLEVLVIALDAIGVPLHVTYNGYILAVHLLAPLAMWGAARLFGLDRASAVVAAALTSALWFFDSLLHWCWFVGMISWCAASCLAILVVALQYRALESRRTLHYVWLALAASALTLTHPFAVITIAPPCLLLYLRRARELDLREHALLGSGAILAASTVFVWIGPALGFRHYIGDTDVFLRPTASFLLLDSLDIWKDVLNTGEPVRTLIRTVSFVAAGLQLVAWRKTRDSRVLPIAVLLTLGLGFSYLGGYSWTVKQTQPYRQLVPAMLAAVLPASVLLAEDVPRIPALPRTARIVLALALVLAVPRAARTALAYVQEARPERAKDRPPSDRLDALAAIEERGAYKKGHEGPPKEFLEVRGWLERNHGGRGRVLVNHWVLGEWLAGFSRIPVLGGLQERNVPHADAHPFRSGAMAKPRGLERYMERYAVGFVVMAGAFDDLDYRRDLLAPAEAFGDYRIYRVIPDPSFIAEGSGVLASQGLNLLAVTGAAPSDLVLRFHYMETLRCRPDCRVERAEVEDDRVGFVRVPSPPPSFEIYNSYEL